MSNIRAIVAETRLGGVEGLWYLATPYARYPFGVDAAATGAAKIAAALLHEGVPVFSPIAHGHVIKQAGAELPHESWMALDELVMATCLGCIVARMPGYHFSAGVAQEIDWFMKAGRPVLFLDVIELLGLPEIFNDATLAHEAAAKLMGEDQPAPFDVQRSSLNPPGTATEQVQKLMGDQHWRDRQQDQRDAILAAHNAGAGMDADTRRFYMHVGFDPAVPGSDKSVHWTQNADGSFAELNPEGPRDVPQPPDNTEQARPDPDFREMSWWRKQRPVQTGALDYFPLAVAEVARISQLGHEQHARLGAVEALHWERTFNNDHADSVARHLAQRGLFGPNNQRHSAAMVWRAMAILQTELEDELLAAGVHARAVFSPASYFYGRPARDYFCIEGSGCFTRADWERRAHEFWGTTCDDEGCPHYGTPHGHAVKLSPDEAFVAGTHWSDEDIAKMKARLDEPLAPVRFTGNDEKENAYFLKGYAAGLHDGQAERDDSSCAADTEAYLRQQAGRGPSDGAMYRAASRAQFTDEENLAFDRELSDFVHGRIESMPLWDAQKAKQSPAPAPDYAGLRNSVERAVADEPTDQAESVQDHAARSLYEMIVEWYSGSTARHISLTNIQRRLKRFWHD